MKKKCMGEKLFVSGLLLSLVLGTGCSANQKADHENVFDSESKEKVELEADSNLEDENIADTGNVVGTEIVEGEAQDGKIPVGDQTLSSLFHSPTWQESYLSILEEGSFEDPGDDNSMIMLSDTFSYDLVRVDDDIYPELLVSKSDSAYYMLSYQNGAVEIHSSNESGSWKDQVPEMKGSYRKDEIINVIKDCILYSDDIPMIEYTYPDLTVDPTDESLSDPLFEDGLSYDDLKGKGFVCCVPCGGFYTDLYMKFDGSFHGEYHYDDYGSEGLFQGESYEMEAEYCSFRGKFGPLEKVDDHTYKTTIVNLNFDKEVGTQEVSDGCLYTYTGLLGFETNQEMYFYLPGKRVNDLEEAFFNDTYIDFPEEGSDQVLNVICMYNAQAEEGFTLENEISDVFAFFQSREACEDYYLSDMEKAGSYLEDKVESTLSRYDMWDRVLNDIWNTLLLVKTDEEMNQLRTEERTWIQLKENTMNKAGQNMTGNEQKQIAIYKVGADLTRERCIELLKLLEDCLE